MYSGEILIHKNTHEKCLKINVYYWSSSGPSDGKINNEADNGHSKEVADEVICSQQVLDEINAGFEVYFPSQQMADFQHQVFYDVDDIDL